MEGIVRLTECIIMALRRCFLHRKHLLRVGDVFYCFIRGT
jgi:hypothetical protein